MEVMVASSVLGLVIVGSLGAFIQSRTITEGSIYQNAATTVVQGYLEQIKEADFANLPYFSGTTLIPSANNDSIVGLSTANRAKAIKTLLNNTDQDTIQSSTGETITDYLLISSGNPPNPKTLVPGAAAPTGVEDNVKLIDVNKTISKDDDLRLRLWVWVQDASNSGIDATQVRSITIIYQWGKRERGSLRWYIGSTRSIRSAVPTM
jgi:hypothetical protein